MRTEPDRRRNRRVRVLPPNRACALRPADLYPQSRPGRRWSNGSVKMTRVRVENFSISIESYGAGPDQSLENPLGVGGEDLHEWVISTRSWREMHGKDGGTTGIHDEFAARGVENFGA